MSHFPDFDTFSKLAEQYDLIPLSRRLLSDTLTPVSAFKHLNDSEEVCLFESVIGGEKVGRYSFLAVNPWMTYVATRNQVSISQHGKEVETFTCDNPLSDLSERIKNQKLYHPPDLPPFCGGAVGYAGYDVIRYVEHLPDAPEDDRKLPDLSFGFYDQMIVFDNVSKTMFVITLARIQPEINLQEIYANACKETDILIEKLTQPIISSAEDIALTTELDLTYESNTTQAEFEAGVNKCVNYIEAGDIFQVVISQRLQVEVQSDPFEIYRTLRVVNPSPFMFLLRTVGVTLIGSSPEIMCRVMDGKVTVRPLAGTRKRGDTEAEDLRLEEELLADPKERAEHVMLVDLGRNDVGRVAQFGTVNLSDVMVVERYSHVMHITSNVTGKLRHDCDAFDALQACLPAGTVSGAPKVRAMEIIDEIEKHRRGPYAGAVGYIDYSGNMDTCIALRTIVLQGNQAYVQAGAGIVADSVASSEYQETLNKAKGLLQAIAITEARKSYE